MILIWRIALAAFGIFVMTGAFLANGGRFDIFSRSRAKPVSGTGRVAMFIAGLLICGGAILPMLSN
jgi:hypothetical protein